jgi:hypothetical protein
MTNLCLKKVPAGLPEEDLDDDFDDDGDDYDVIEVYATCSTTVLEPLSTHPLTPIKHNIPQIPIYITLLRVIYHSKINVLL